MVDLEGFFPFCDVGLDIAWDMLNPPHHLTQPPAPLPPAPWEPPAYVTPLQPIVGPPGWIDAPCPATPVPEASTLVMLAMGLTMFMLVGKRRVAYVNV